MDETMLGGRYRRVRELGRGAMGQVWLAEDTLLHRRVAIKSVSSGMPAEPADLTRVMREARLAAQLNHPNAVAVYDVVVENDRPYVVMEYASGKSLAEMIAQGPLPVDEVARIGSAVADALGEAHGIGLVHRDVKPANIMVTDRGVPKLADFGIARLAADAEGTATGLAIGTPAYLAPELARGEGADARSDLWALGVTLYAALDGRSPFQQPGDNAFTVIARIANTPEAPPPRNGGALTPTIMRLLAVDPARRPSAEQTVQMLRDDLAAGKSTAHLPLIAPYTLGGGPPQPPWSGAPPPGQPPYQPPPPPRYEPPPPSYYEPTYTGPLFEPSEESYGPRPGERRRTVVALLAAVLVVAAGVGVAIWLTSRHSGTPAAGGTSSSAVSGTPSAPATAPTASGAGSSSPSGPASQTSPSTAATQRYASYGGVSVLGPPAWQQDDSSRIPTIHDFDAPGADRDGTFFRLGIGDTTAHTLAQTQTDAETFLHKYTKYRDVRIVSETGTSIAGAPAVDIEYTGNYRGIARHVIERLWVANGNSLILELNTPESQWVQYRPVFDQLVNSATVSG